MMSNGLAPSGLLPEIMKQFKMSQVEGTLTVSLFIGERVFELSWISI
jgi:hypothetical protein